MTHPVPDPYGVLGLPPSASQAELKAAHRALVRRHHPDLQPPELRAQATRRVQDINVAFGMVRDTAHRRRTDELLRTANKGRDWDAAATEAGRWAGRWWLRNRGAARRAGRAGRRAVVGTIGRVIWLLASLLGAGVGFVASNALARMFVAKPLIATLGGALIGLLLGSEYGAGQARRLAGEASSPWVLRVLAGVWVAAFAVGVLVDFSLAR